LVGWLWFLGVLVPTMGIVHVGIQAMADRFIYVPIIGLLLMLCFGAKDALLVKLNGSKIAAIGAVIVVSICGALSRVQVSYWKNDLALFEHARLVTKDNYMAYNVLGGLYLRQG